MLKYGSWLIGTTIELEEADQIKVKIVPKCSSFAHVYVTSENKSNNF